MNRFSTVAVAVAALLLAAGLPVGSALGQEKAQDTSDVDRVKAASQVFIVAIAARDIRAMDKVWAHESYATFIGPLSTTIVVGWDGVRKAWEMRFGQFDRLSFDAFVTNVFEEHDRRWLMVSHQATPIFRAAE
jgi:SnoaL-like protein